MWEVRIEKRVGKRRKVSIILGLFRKQLTQGKGINLSPVLN